MLTLQINNIEETDDAEYVCEVIVGINKKIKEKVDLRSEIQQMDFEDGKLVSTIRQVLEPLIIKR